MNIILTSNGFHNKTKRSKEIDEEFKKIANGRKIVIITNATKEGSNAQNIPDVKDNFGKVGATKVDLLEINPNNVKDIFNYDVIYIMGGDPRPLIDDMWECNFKEHLINFVKTGVLIGESAGSMVLCDNIKWIWDIKKEQNLNMIFYQNHLKD